MNLLNSAKAVWDETSDPANPGWAIEIEYQNGQKNIIPTCPWCHNLPNTPKNAKRVVRETLEWEKYKLVKSEAK